jgi:hypothetical protein
MNLKYHFLQLENKTGFKQQSFISTASQTVQINSLNLTSSTPWNPITYTDPQIATPNATATGRGGVAKINAGNSRRIIYWSVTPNTAWVYNFIGKISLNYYSGYRRDVALGGFGGLGSTVSGSITMNKNNGGYAQLSGRAVSITGKQYFVLPGVGTSY